MGEALESSDEISSGLPTHRVIIGTHVQVAAHPGGQVHDDLGVLGPDSLHDLFVEGDGSRTLAGLQVSDVAVHDRRPGSRCIKCRSGNLGRCHRHLGTPTCAVT